MAIIDQYGRSEAAVVHAGNGEHVGEHQAAFESKFEHRIGKSGIGAHGFTAVTSE